MLHKNKIMILTPLISEEFNSMRLAIVPLHYYGVTLRQKLYKISL